MKTAHPSELFPVVTQIINQTFTTPVSPRCHATGKLRITWMVVAATLTLVTAGCGSGGSSEEEDTTQGSSNQDTVDQQGAAQNPATENAEPNPDTTAETGDPTTTVPAPTDSANSVANASGAELATGLFESTSSTGFTGTVMDDGGIQLSWPAADNAEGYNVYRGAEYQTTVASNSHLDSGLAQGSYYYEIVAFDADSNFQTIAEGLTVTLTASPELGSALPGTTAGTAQESPLPQHITDDYDLVFSDEFVSTTLDTSKWNTSYLWGDELIINSEEQHYVDIKNKPDFGYNPFSLDGDVLTIESVRTPENLLDKANGQRYLSGVITSYDSFKFTYGYVEARVKVPYGQGFWSAFWLLNAYYVEQKPEIDIMEHIGNDRDVAYHTYHYYDSAGKLHSTKSMETSGIDFTGDFHTFAVEWKPGKIIYYVNGIERHSISDSKVSSQEMYIIANTALGGWWPGPPDQWTPFPANYQIDYIRAYQKRGVQEDAPLNDGIQTIPLADDVPGKSPNHIPPPELWPAGYPELPQ